MTNSAQSCVREPGQPRSPADSAAIAGTATTSVDTCRFSDRRQRADRAYRETQRIALDREVGRLANLGLYCADSGSEFHIYRGKHRVDSVVAVDGDGALAVRAWVDQQNRVDHIVADALSRLSTGGAVFFYTHREWLAEGARRFGPNEKLWGFRCPACGTYQRLFDWHQAQAPLTAVAVSCVRGWLDEPPSPELVELGVGVCTYRPTAELQLNPVRVLLSDGSIVRVFEFADDPEEIG